MSITISLDPARQDLDAIHEILAGTYWSPGIRREVVADRATFAWLCDVFVVEPFRGQGISRRLIAELERHPSLQTVRRWCLATRDAEELYAKFGYGRIPPSRIWMEKQGPKDRWQAAP